MFETPRATYVARAPGTVVRRCLADEECAWALGRPYEEDPATAWQSAAYEFQGTANLFVLEQHAAALGVSIDALFSLGVGLDLRRGFTTWPMRDAAGRVCGIQCRYLDGKKRSMPGSRLGYFGLALDELDERDEAFGRGNFLLVTEGASDAAAGCSLGLTTIGRASANPGLRADRGALRACSVASSREQEPWWSRRPTGSAAT